ncbi:MAG: hypothetical protein VKP62_10940 [Candidatus Sericytochromatia bacterium]|nr:hypothetical protein [Candidatus Sericytochromatia bacterium]
MTFFHASQPDDATLLLPNFPALRVECVERLRREPCVGFTELEIQVLCGLFASAARAHILSPRYQGPTGRKGHRDWRDNEGLVIINRDLEELPQIVPKWTLLFSWLAPESAISHCPDLVAEIASLMLSGKLALHKSDRG